jgi:hypothetical protein
MTPRHIAHSGAIAARKLGDEMTIMSAVDSSEAPSRTDCEKSFVRAGIPSAMAAKTAGRLRLESLPGTGADPSGSDLMRDGIRHSCPRCRRRSSRNASAEPNVSPDGSFGD